MNAHKFTITETEPTSLIRDFQSFLEYIEAKKPYLTLKDYLCGKGPFEMSQRVAPPLEGTTVRTGQEFYPQLHLFFPLSPGWSIGTKGFGKGK